MSLSRFGLHLLCLSLIFGLWPRYCLSKAEAMLERVDLTFLAQCGMLIAEAAEEKLSGEDVVLGNWVLV